MGAKTALATCCFLVASCATVPSRPADDLDLRIAKQIRQALNSEHCARRAYTGTRVARVVCETPGEAVLRQQQADLVIGSSFRPIY